MVHLTGWPATICACFIVEPATILLSGILGNKIAELIPKTTTKSKTATEVETQIALLLFCFFVINKPNLFVLMRHLVVLLFRSNMPPFLDLL